MNEAISLYLNTLAANSIVWSHIAFFLAKDLSYVLIGVLIYFFFKSNKKNKKKHFHTVLFALFAGLFSRYILKGIIVTIYPVARPYIAHTQITLLIPPLLGEEFQSFPSGHALFFFAVSSALFFHHKKLGSFFFISSILIGLGRVMVGVHYPLDILCGAVIGIATSFALSFIIKKRYAL